MKDESTKYKDGYSTEKKHNSTTVSYSINNDGTL